MSGPYRGSVTIPQDPSVDPNVVSEPMQPTQRAPLRTSGPTTEQVKAAQDILNAYNNAQNEPDFPDIDEKYQESYDAYFNKNTPHADRGKVVLAEDVSSGVTSLGILQPDGSVKVGLLVTVGDYSKLFGG
jgi:hypothetical protein